MVSWVTAASAVTEAEELAVMGCSIYADAVSATGSSSHLKWNTQVGQQNYNSLAFGDDE